MFKKIFFTLIMIVFIVGLSFIISSLISRGLDLPVYDVMSGIGLLIMLVGGISSIDEHTLRLGSIPAPYLNTMMNAVEVSANKLSNQYRQGMKNIALEGMGSKLKIILAGAVVFVVSVIISLL